MLTAAILPVKRFAEAKRRLGQSVEDPLRLALAAAMVGDVLRALSETEAIDRTIVVTGEPSIRTTALELGASVIDDTAESGQSAAVALGVHRALADGVERVLCVPGDCPALDPGELHRLLAAGHGAVPAGGEVVIVPDRHGSGTNGLMLTPPDVIEPSFGPDSCERHLGLARRAGATWRLERPPSLLLDIDTGADLQALGERLTARPGRAWATRAVLLGGRPSDGLSVTTPV